jgi:AmmeMemoRadiSam system protein B
MIRNTAVAGQFYSDKAHELEEQIAHFNTILDDNIKQKELFEQKARMIIVPHAGYIYSGFTANVAHRILAASKAKRVVVIGPSHRVYIDGASIALHDSYETPLGIVTMDSAYAQSLKQKHHLIFQKDAHAEHSTETQIPFIKYYLPDAKLCEIVYGDVSYETIAQVIDTILEDPLNVVVISTDLSHFYTLDEANSLDNSCLEAMEKLDVAMMQSGPCEACGKIGVLAALTVAKQKALSLTLLDYRTSADITQDTKSVVGYVSAMIG